MDQTISYLNELWEVGLPGKFQLPKTSLWLAGKSTNLKAT